MRNLSICASEADSCHADKMKYGLDMGDSRTALMIWNIPSTSETEDKHIPCSIKNLAQTKKEQCWCYDPTIKYEALRKCAVPRYAYHDDSPSDWTDSEMLTETMTEEEAQTQKQKILAEAKEEQPFTYDYRIKYDILKQYFYLDSPDSLAYSNLILNYNEEENQAKIDEFNSVTTQCRLCFVGSDSDLKTKTGTKTGTEMETETETEEESEVETMEEDEAHKEQLFLYDPSIIYKPLKRYIVPRFGFYDTSSTDWSASSDSSALSDSESEIKTTEEEEATSQEDKILAGSKDKQLFQDDLVKSASTNLQSIAQDLAKSPSGHLQSKPAVSEPSFLGSYGAKNLAEVGDKVVKEAKEMNSYTGVEKVLSYG